MAAHEAGHAVFAAADALALQLAGDARTACRTTIKNHHPVASRQIVTKTEHSSQSFVALVD
jgi:hypothetical protein